MAILEMLLVALDHTNKLIDEAGDKEPIRLCRIRNYLLDAIKVLNDSSEPTS